MERFNYRDIQKYRINRPRREDFNGYWITRLRIIINRERFLIRFISFSLSSMLEKQKNIFVKWKIWIKDYGDFILVSYRQWKRTTTQKIYKAEKVLDILSKFLIDIYYEYEWDRETPMTEEILWLLTLTDQSTVSRRINYLLDKMKKKSQWFYRSKLQS